MTDTSLRNITAARLCRATEDLDGISTEIRQFQREVLAGGRGHGSTTESGVISRSRTMAQCFPGLEARRQTPHFAMQRKTLKDRCDGRAQTLVCATVFPTPDEGSQALISNLQGSPYFTVRISTLPCRRSIWTLASWARRLITRSTEPCPTRRFLMRTSCKNGGSSG
jgi:hypothetical protein